MILQVGDKVRMKKQAEAVYPAFAGVDGFVQRRNDSGWIEVDFAGTICLFFADELARVD